MGKYKTIYHEGSIILVLELNENLPEGLDMSIGSVIKEARLRKNIKQSTVASEVGVTVQTYIKWEGDETEPKASQVAKLSEILGLPCGSICKGETFNKWEMTAFMRQFSKVAQAANDFEVGLTIWNNIDDDNTFIKELRKNAGVEYAPAAVDFDHTTGEVYEYDEFGNQYVDPIELRKEK